MDNSSACLENSGTLNKLINPNSSSTDSDRITQAWNHLLAEAQITPHDEQPRYCRSWITEKCLEMECNLTNKLNESKLSATSFGFDDPESDEEDKRNMSAEVPRLSQPLEIPTSPTERRTHTKNLVRELILSLHTQMDDCSPAQRRMIEISIRQIQDWVLILDTESPMMRSSLLEEIEPGPDSPIYRR